MYKLIVRIFKSPITYIFICYFILASIITAPFIINPANTMTAPVGGDEGNSIIKFDAINREGLNPFVDNKMGTIAVPDGLTINNGVDRASFLSTLYLWFTSSLTNAIFTHSLEAFLGYTLTAMVMFMFVKRVTGSNYAGFLAGLIIGFCPTNILFAISSPTYSHIWVLILPIWAFWNLVTYKSSNKNVILATLSIMPAMFWTPYYTYYALLMGFTFLCTSVIIALKSTAKRRVLLVAALIALVWLLLTGIYYIVGMSANGQASIPVRTAQEAYEQSSHPIMYLLPGPFSWWGADMHQWFSDNYLPKAKPTTIYLGIMTTALSAVAIYYLFKRKLSTKQKNATIMALSMCVVAFLFSLPPTVSVGSFEVATPSYLTTNLVPALRAGQRLVVVLLIGASVMGSIGAYMLTKRVNIKYRYIVMFAIVVLVSADMFIWPSPLTTKIIPNKAYFILEERDNGLTAHYNNNSLVSKPGQDICFQQFTHKKPLVNDCEINRDWYNPDVASKTLNEVIKLPICDQFYSLYKMGVRYLIISGKNDLVINCIIGLQLDLIASEGDVKIYQFKNNLH